MNVNWLLTFHYYKYLEYYILIEAIDVACDAWTASWGTYPTNYFRKNNV